MVRNDLRLHLPRAALVPRSPWAGMSRAFGAEQRPTGILGPRSSPLSTNHIAKVIS
jgi:hypothetical protein